MAEEENASAAVSWPLLVDIRHRGVILRSLPVFYPKSSVEYAASLWIELAADWPLSDQSKIGSLNYTQSPMTSVDSSTIFFLFLRNSSSF